MLNSHVSRRTGVLAGYSHPWDGFLWNTAGPNALPDAGQFFTRTTYRW